MSLTLAFKKLTETAICPSMPHTQGSVGYDVFSDETHIMKPNATHRFSTGIIAVLERKPQLYIEALTNPAAKSSNNQYIQVQSRSGLAMKGVIAIGGVIDNDYRGELGIILCNTSATNHHVINRGDKIAQLVVIRIDRPQVRVLNIDESFDETERGSKGFGSSGK